MIIKVFKFNLVNTSYLYLLKVGGANHKKKLRLGFGEKQIATSLSKTDSKQYITLLDIYNVILKTYFLNVIIDNSHCCVQFIIYFTRRVRNLFLTETKS